eukprot:607276-Prymnesium_polylepis.2
MAPSAFESKRATSRAISAPLRMLKPRLRIAWPNSLGVRVPEPSRSHSRNISSTRSEERRSASRSANSTNSSRPITPSWLVSMAAKRSRSSFS